MITYEGWYLRVIFMGMTCTKEIQWINLINHWWIWMIDF